ncbi:MAG: 1,4-dihydroxy-6-naphthoate synthase [Planctomycetota bacterium]
MNSSTLKIAISTCPNDTFAFAAILDGRVQSEKVKLDIWLGDISELNERLVGEAFDVGKASYAALATVADRWSILPVGSALGYGNGPLLLTGSRGASLHSQGEVDFELEKPPRVLCPGELTTATYLMRRFYPEFEIEHAVFSEIMPAVQSGEVEYGVCIHEGRFTYQEQGLDCVADLGQKWHEAVGGPLPLGGLFASVDLDDELIEEARGLIARSLELARQDPQSALPMMRQHAQEFDDEVLMRHVDLYVNEETAGLTSSGRGAISAMMDARFWAV